MGLGFISLSIRKYYILQFLFRREKTICYQTALEYLNSYTIASYPKKIMR